MKKTLALLVMPAAVFAVATVPANAGPSRGGATLQVSVLDDGARVATSTPTVGNTLVFSGCGYMPGADVKLYVNGPTATSFMGAAAGADGCFSTADRAFPADVSGAYKAAAYQSSNKRADASAAFTVAP